MYLERGGGYYFNVGCSELIADKKIPVISFKDIASFQADGMALVNGSSQQFDAMVLATGATHDAALKAANDALALIKIQVA